MLSMKTKALIRQFMVSASVSLSMMEHSLVMGYTAVLLPQLRAQAHLGLDDTSASWIASIVGLTNTIGILCVPPLISKCGRRCSNLVSAVLVVLGWLCVALVPNVKVILFARAVQGVGLGISSLTSAVLIAEYTTPRYRGAFLTMMSFGILFGSLVVHTLGSCLNWTNTAFVCLIIAVFDCILIILSPESPMFLATRGKYDECRKVFHWLRGFDDEEELEDMIKADIMNKRKHKSDMKQTIRNGFLTFKKPRFYKPIIVMLHLHWCNVLCGCIMMDAYGADIVHIIIGEGINTMFMLVSMDVVRIVSTMLATVLNTKVRRRSMIKIFITLNILAYFIIAAYYYTKTNQLLPHHPYIGIALIYFLMFTMGAGTAPIVNIISGEIFPLAYKNVSVTMTTLIMCLSIALKLKTLPTLLQTIDLHGTFALYGFLMLYGLVVALAMLPETKDLTLQNIEESFFKEDSEEDLSKTKKRELHELIIKD